MKVLLIAPQPPPYGGIANWTAMMLEYVKGTDDCFKTINTAPKKRSTEGRNIFDRVVVSGFDMLRKKRELKAQIKKDRPDVIHMTTSGSLAIIRDVLLLKTAKKYGVPTVYHIRFGKTGEMAESNSRLWRLFSKAMKTADTVIAIDNKTFCDIKKYLPDVNVRLVPNPVNTSSLPSSAQEIKKQVVFLGWVIPEKGVSELVKAWNTVGAEYSDYNLLIIGQSNTEYYEELKIKAKVPNIIFAGELPHNKAMEAVAESEVFILPSYTEGFPNAVVEAMALKKPVIASAVGAIPEMLEGDCGILIEPRSADDIISALKKTLTDKELRERISSNAAEKVNKQYKIEIVYEKYKEIWSHKEGVTE